jgi:hypothetical protein
MQAPEVHVKVFRRSNASAPIGRRGSVTNETIGTSLRLTSASLVRLLELEAALATQRIHTSSRGLKTGAALAGAGLLAVSSSVTLLLALAAVALAFVLPLWLSLLIVAIGIGGAGAILATAALRRLRTAARGLSEAAEQIKEDARWLKKSIH